MSELRRPNQEAIDLTWMAVEAADRAFDEAAASQVDFQKVFEVANMGVEGVTVTPDALDSISDETTNALVNQEYFANMAGAVITPEFNPFDIVPDQVDSGASETERLTTNQVMESIAEQLPAAHGVYGEVVDIINGGRKKKEVLVPDITEEQAVTELSMFLTQDKLQYVADAMEADPELKFTLVATPNWPVTDEELIKIAEQFGADQPHQTAVWPDIYGKYTPEEISGYYPKNDSHIKFTLVSSKFHPELSGTAGEQHAALDVLQIAAPFLRVPSPVEAVAHAMVLRTQGDSLDSGDVFDRTYVRSFDLPQKEIDGDLYVPDFFVYDDGGPYLDLSYVRDDDYGSCRGGVETLLLLLNSFSFSFL